jgi:hypothetical protein
VLTFSKTNSTGIRNFSNSTYILSNSSKKCFRKSNHPNIISKINSIGIHNFSKKSHTQTSDKDLVGDHQELDRILTVTI